MEPADIPLPKSGSSARPSSSSASPSPFVADSERPFAALRPSPSPSSSHSLSAWPFVAERSPSPSSCSPSYDSRLNPYRPVKAKDWVSIYPPALPPPDFFDLEEEEKWIKEEMFKKDDIHQNTLYDETGKVNLPVNKKGILILDPESRTRMIDARVEVEILDQYFWWIDSAIDEAEELGGKQTVTWLNGLRFAVAEDFQTVNKEHHTLLDEERKKRGLTDLKTYMDWWHTKGYMLAQHLDNEKEQRDKRGECTEPQSESTCPFGAVPTEDEDYVEDEALTDDTRAVQQEDRESSPAEALNVSLDEYTTTSERSPTHPTLDLATLWW